MEETTNKCLTNSEEDSSEESTELLMCEGNDDETSDDDSSIDCVNEKILDGDETDKEDDVENNEEKEERVADVEAERATEVVVEPATEVEVERVTEVEVERVADVEVERVTEVQAEQVTEVDVKQTVEKQTTKVEMNNAEELKNQNPDKLPGLTNEEIQNSFLLKDFTLYLEKQTEEINTLCNTRFIRRDNGNYMFIIEKTLEKPRIYTSLPSRCIIMVDNDKVYQIESLKDTMQELQVIETEKHYVIGINLEYYFYSYLTNTNTCELTEFTTKNF
jgi:hypothetical protein